MCLAVPAKLKEIISDKAGIVDYMGVKTEVALDFVPKVQIGDFVLVHAGFAIEIVTEKVANETLELLNQFPELIEI